MALLVKTRLIKIGRSKGFRITKRVLEQVKFGRDLIIEVQSDKLIIRPMHHPRAHWGKAFRKMAERGDDQLLDPECVATKWEADWHW